ncbi:hypothetical protein GPNADHDJ_00802 [Stenotrophomonas maltophilia]|jgi:phosphomevalonate kinase|uniref:DUF1963 domain-containing protein n=1 Tax=Stenotrophomonas maltophilia TaxID=40324 RepID=A0AAX1I9S2_STEMA|nr:MULTISPECIES: hypothetical protein [Stenotrophomonas]KXU98245.1 hypothetical protein AB839_04000 [Stenotrophomonas sp. DDT-1]MBN5108992.1 hypothetical protein [Stenotrophomonas maltophilia]QGL79120.1 hypothetical protein FEO94_03225 [Stenotrophomonas maltophilia]QNG76626.1 hypothetical protein GPNADHDJ_00802 [Stenotrophomonas maltophilia]
MRWPWSAAPPPRLEDAQADVLLQDLLSRDATRITDAARIVARLFSAPSLDALAAHVDLIERSCHSITLGGMLISNQAHLEAALKRLRHWQAHAGCLCALNPGYPFFDPRRLIEQGQMQLLALQEAEDGWGDCHNVACMHCGQHWQAIDREYHYPWWEWKAA